MKGQNAIVVVAGSPDVARSGGGDPFAALPWEDLDTVFHGCAADVVQSALAVPDSDVIVWRDRRFPATRLAAQTGDRVRQFDLPDGPMGEALQQAMDGAFLEFYHRVVVVLENNPLVGTAALASAVDQLGVEDECAVVVPAEGGGVVAVALKNGCRGLFSDGAAASAERSEPSGADVATAVEARWSGVLRRLCEEELLLFPMQPSFALDSTASLERLRTVISALDPDLPGFPKRTGAAFRAIEKKYRWKRPRP